jgi:short-subunit dehydrogenase
MADSNERPLALVTGASSGLGSAFAERLAQDGYDLVVVARRRDRLEALRVRLEEQERANVEIIVADLSRLEGLQPVEERLAGESRLEMLINNTGFAGYMPSFSLAPIRPRS